MRREDKLPSCGALTYMHDGLQVTVGDLVTLMIILSDNTATNLLIDKLGRDAINQTIRKLGLTATQLNRKLFMPELSRQGIENYVSAHDMCVFFELLLAEKIVSPEASREMLGILRNQRLNGKMPFYLLHDRGIQIAHKTGEDDGITNDVGVVSRTRRSFSASSATTPSSPKPSAPSKKSPRWCDDGREWNSGGGRFSKEKRLPRAPSRRDVWGGETLGGEAASLREAPLPQTPLSRRAAGVWAGCFSSGLVPPVSWARFPVAWLWSRRLTEPPRPASGGIRSMLV